MEAVQLLMGKIKTKIEILSDQPVSMNFAERNRGSVCAYPQSTVLDNGDIACLYRQGASRHSYDGTLVMQTSSDYGASWSVPQIVFDGCALHPPQSVVSGGICQTGTGSLFVTFGLVDASKQDAYLFSKEGMTFKRQVCASQSEDGGKTWSQPTQIDTSPFQRAGITTKPFILPDKVICVPIEVKTSFGPQGTALTFSSDDGRSFEPLLTCAVDPKGQLNLCDARFTTLENGDILMSLWTFLQESEETVNIHQSFSSDCGRTWSSPEDTGIHGQVTVPLALSSGKVIAATNHRHPPEGVRLFLSSDQGRTWNKNNPVQMWDLRSGHMLGEPILNKVQDSGDKGVWKELEQFTFGTPDLVNLSDGSILLTYYATINNIIHVRACRFHLEN